MKVYSAATHIKASKETIWKLLTDAPGFPAWDPGVKQIEGTIAPGQRLVIHQKSTTQKFPVKVTDFVPGERMTWVGGMPLGLFKGVRTYTLTPRDNGIDFSVAEVFSGPLLPLMGRFVPDLTPMFEAFAAGLKARAEAG